MKRVLLADDNLGARQLLAASLARAGVDILEASNGDEAWRLLEQRHPDVALLDVNMAGRSGLEVTKAVRENVELAQTPIILVSAAADEEDIEAGMAAGATYYLTKPFSPRRLLELVTENLRP